MAKKQGARDPYRGRAGQMVAVSEILLRQCNAAIPEVDIGTDVFAFKDDRAEVARVQVKMAEGKPYITKPGYVAAFNIPTGQLARGAGVPLYYALVVRLADQWADTLVISRVTLASHWNGNQPFGFDNAEQGWLELKVRFSPDSVLCNQVDLTAFRNAWHLLPPMQPRADVEGGR